MIYTKKEERNKVGVQDLIKAINIKLNTSTLILP